MPDHTGVDDGWPVSVLDRAGQQAFWDRQAADYELADMTLDNGGELDLVRELCRQFCRTGYHAEDVVTLGGAVGSRDPKVVLEVLEHNGKRPTTVYFNDLSEPMTKKAVATELASYAAQGACKALPGPIHEAARLIVSRPRRIIVGIYRMDAFVSANPHYGYELDGLAEYQKNAEKIGTHLVIEPVCLSGDGYVVLPQRTTAYSGTPLPKHAAATIAARAQGSRFDAMRVIGTHPGQEGFFLSHWYTEAGIRKLLSRCFSEQQLANLSLMPCAKGFVICIDPPEPPQGIVTILNNVVGNVLPHEQVATLRAIAHLAS